MLKPFLLGPQRSGRTWPWTPASLTTPSFATRSRQEGLFKFMNRPSSVHPEPLHWLLLSLIFLSFTSQL